MEGVTWWPPTQNAGTELCGSGSPEGPGPLCSGFWPLGLKWGGARPSGGWEPGSYWRLLGSGASHGGGSGADSVPEMMSLRGISGLVCTKQQEGQLKFYSCVSLGGTV